MSESEYTVAWWKVADAANEIYTAEAVRVWMTVPSRMLEDRSPEDLIRAGETQRVMDYIDFLAEGNFA